MQFLMRYRDLVLPLGIIGCLVVILVPLPPLLMDLLLAGNITIAVIVLEMLATRKRSPVVTASPPANISGS